MEVTRKLAQAVIIAGVFALTGLGGAGGGALASMIAKLRLKSREEKPTFGGENLSFSMSRQWFLRAWAGAGAIIAALVTAFILYQAIATELPSYLP